MSDACCTIRCLAIVPVHGAPQRLLGLVRSLLAKNPRHRPQSMAVVILGLHAALHDSLTHEGRNPARHSGMLSSAVWLKTQGKSSGWPAPAAWSGRGCWKRLLQAHGVRPHRRRNASAAGSRSAAAGEPHRALCASSRHNSRARPATRPCAAWAPPIRRPGPRRRIARRRSSMSWPSPGRQRPRARGALSCCHANLPNPARVVPRRGSRARPWTH